MTIRVKRVCEICGKPHYAREYCRKHYNNWSAGRPLEPIKCRFPNCTKKVTKYVAHELCAVHYQKLRREIIQQNKVPQRNHAFVRRHKKDYCEKCGKTREETKLDGHHKDFNPLNDIPANIQTLCKHCHWFLHRERGIPSKYRNIYGFSVDEMCAKLKVSRRDIRFLHHKGLLKKNLSCVKD